MESNLLKKRSGRNTIPSFHWYNIPPKHNRYGWQVRDYC